MALEQQRQLMAIPYAGAWHARGVAAIGKHLEELQARVAAEME